MSGKFPVVAEIYSTFESILQVQAKRLVEDIAKHQNVDSRELWNKVRQQIQIGLVDIELEDDSPAYCNHPSASTEGAVKTLCRSPCLIGFSACPRHVNVPLKHATAGEEHLKKVKRVIDYSEHTYFVDEDNIVRDKNGKVKGEMIDDVLHLFEKAAAASEAAPSASLEKN